MIEELNPNSFETEKKKDTSLVEVLYDRRKSEGTLKASRTYQDPGTTTRSPRKRHREHLPTVNVLYAFFETTVVGFEWELPWITIDKR